MMLAKEKVFPAFYEVLTHPKWPVRLGAMDDKLTPQMKAALKKIPKNGSLTFTNVKVKGPSGRVSRLESGIVLKLI